MRLQALQVATGFIPLVAMAWLTAGSAAYADTASGVLKSVDPTGHKITLSSGKVYMVNAGISLSGYKAGEMVAIQYTPAEAIWQSLGVAGDVSSIMASK
jgi:hypothetical protein